MDKDKSFDELYNVWMGTHMSPESFKELLGKHNPDLLKPKKATPQEIDANWNKLEALLAKGSKK